TPRSRGPRIEAPAGALFRRPPHSDRDGYRAAAPDRPDRAGPDRSDSAAAGRTARRSPVRSRSDVEAFAAAALVANVRIVELESLVQPFLREIELRAIEIRQALRIDDDRDAVAVEAMILGPNLVGVFELVGETRAAGGAHAQAQPDALPAFRKRARHVPGRVFGKRDHRCIHTTPLRARQPAPPISRAPAHQSR